MHIVDQTALGAFIVLLLAILVVIKRVSTGSILEKPPKDLLLWLVNSFNLFFLLVANPLAAILLLAGRLEGADPTSLVISSQSLLMVVEVGGMVIYLTGFLGMGWALVTLGKNYQLGGSDPRSTDILITRGPYALVRHPMYTAALCIALGLAGMIVSLGCLAAFIIYLFLILALVPVEEERLLQAYGEPYARYQRNVGKLIPFLYRRSVG